MCSILAAIFASCFLVSITRAENHLVARRDRGGNKAVSLPGSVLPTSTAAAPAPTLLFNRIEQMTACNPATISWLYQGSSSALTLVVTDMNVVQSGPGIVNSREIRRRQYGYYITSLLTLNADPTIENFTWPQVLVPQGYYVVEANVLTLSTQSLPFYVTNGTDTSCLLSSSTSASSPMSTTPSVTSDAPVSTSSSAALDTANLSTHVNTGAVAGGVIGGLAAVAVIAALIFFLCRKPLSRALRSRGSAGAWRGLDSKTNTSGKPRKSGLKVAFGGIDVDPFRSNAGSRTDSIGQLNANPERTFNAIGVSDEDVTSISPSEEKVITHANNEMFTGIRSSVGTLESLPPLPYRDNRRSSASVKYADNANYGRPRRANSYGNSTTDGWVMNGRGSIDENGGSAEGEMIPMGRSASGNGGDNMHKTPRKPVPVYDPYEPPLATTIYRQHGSNVNDSSSDHKFNSKVSLSSQQSVAMQMGLNHKDSFGDMGPNRPVHYLIPDLPPSAIN